MCPIISRYPIRAIVACRILFIKTLFTYFNTKITIIIYHHPLDQIILDFHLYVQIVHDPWAMSTQNALRFYRKKIISHGRIPKSWTMSVAWIEIKVKVCNFQSASFEFVYSITNIDGMNRLHQILCANDVFLENKITKFYKVRFFI